MGLIKTMVESNEVIECDRMGLVFNRVQGNEGLLLDTARDMGLEVFGLVPYDESVAHHDLVGRPLIELSANSRGMAAVREITEKWILD